MSEDNRTMGCYVMGHEDNREKEVGVLTRKWETEVLREFEKKLFLGIDK